MKVIKGIKKVVTGILGIAFFIFAISMTILLLNHNDYGVIQIDNTSLVLIKEQISSENYQRGDLVFVESKRLSNINVGDEIFVYQLDSRGVSGIDLGTVGFVNQDERNISFENGETYSIEFVIGESSRVYNSIGTYLSIVQSQWGFLFIVLVPSFLIFIYQLYALVIEIKYGDENELSYS